ncbi:MAG: RdgB/HAM1 family non-canonical purine NTP pyrophosphatase [Clostridia bacterium]|nr:RdgB/HAM1 family non-canonical purine NTP pyrophosphatase [Clostridia bacterium]
MKTFIIATHNKKKLAELERILAPLGISAQTAEQAGFTLDEPEETGTIFEENAYIKALAAMKATGMPAVADDSGLEVDALGGAPGVYSARYGAPEVKTDEGRYLRLLNEMRDIPDGQRTARFVSAVCCVFPDGECITVRGTCEGTIAFAPVGSGGFGYDPIFLVGDKTYGELDAAEKDRISHRGQALRKLRAALAEKMG